MVAVVAESRYLAEDALDRIEIAYEPLETVIDPERAASKSAPLLHEEAGTNILATREFARSDLAEAMTLAAVRVGGRFRFHRKAPVSLEPRACLAEYDRGRRMLTLTTSTQIPGIFRDVLADLLKMPGLNVRVIAPDVGGGFGGKASLYPEEIIVAVLARRLGRLVRWNGSRSEDLVLTKHGFDEIVDAELGLDGSGHILALAAEVIGDIGAYSIYPWTATLEPVQVASFTPGPSVCQPITDMYGRSRPARPRPAPVAALAGRSRPL